MKEQLTTDLVNALVPYTTVSTQDLKMIRILLQGGLNVGTVVYLCGDCRRELYEKI